MTGARLNRLLSRSLLSLAIVTCLLGLPQASAAAFGGTAGAPVVAALDLPGHGSAKDVALAPTPPSREGHAAHDEGAAVHVVGCMVALGILAFALLMLTVLQAGSLGAAGRRLRARVRAGLQPRPPSLVSLCILRV